eukprot:s5037_g1.t1
MTPADTERATRRAGLLLQADRVIRPVTRSNRAKLAEAFSSWLFDTQGRSLETLIAVPFDQVEQISEALVAFGQHLFRSGQAYYKFSETINAVASLRPSIRRSLTRPWDLAFAWLTEEPSIHHRAMPKSILLAIMSVALLWGWPVEAAIFGMSWAGLLRIGETLNAVRADLILPDDAAPGFAHALLQIRSPKTRGRAARHQAARIDPADIICLLCAVLGPLPPSAKLWPFSDGVLRRRFRAIQTRLGLQDRNGPLFDLASLRPGGATWMLERTENAELVRRRGRWLSGRVMEIYLQEVTAATFVARLPKDVRNSVEQLEQSFAAILQKADVTETYLDEEDEEVQTTSKLEADPATKELVERAELQGWGRLPRPAFVSIRDKEFVMDLVEETMGAVCGVIPDVMIAPFGAGVALNPGEICDGISELLGAVKNFAGPASGFHFARQGWSIEQEGYAACNPMQIGFARAFCDIHCVRDAVIRGDRSIIRNLEMATKKTNNNLKALVKWSVDASHTDIGWIGEKLDYMHIINTAYMQEIHDMVTKQSQAAEEGRDQKEELVQGTESATDALFSEMAGYAQAASFDELSKITAKGALEEFLESADLSPKANATAAASLLARLDALHQTLQRAGRGREKSEMLNRQVAQTVRHLQRQASFHLRTLGVYRQESNASSHAARGKGHKALARERHQVLMSLDHIWWQLRTKLDGYLDVAEDEVKAFQTSLAEMNSYLELCLKLWSE